MSTHHPTRSIAGRLGRIVPVALVATLAALTAGPVRAEVAVALAQRGDETTPISSYILQITDDSSPILGSWAPVTAPSVNRVTLNASGDDTGDGPPSLVHDADSGLIAVAWSRDLGNGGHDIVISRFDGTAWTAPSVVSAAVENEVEPRLAVDSTAGLVHVVYQVDAAVPRIEHRQAPLDLSSWSAPTFVSAPADIALRPSVAIHEGAVRVAYEMHPLGIGVTPRQVVVAQAQTGGGFTNQIVATTYHGEPNRPELHAAPGRLWVDWIDAEGDMAYSRLEPGGAWSAPTIEPFAGAQDRDFAVRGRIRGQILKSP